jgi:hypothetical protein
MEETGEHSSDVTRGREIDYFFEVLEPGCVDEGKWGGGGRCGGCFRVGGGEREDEEEG